MKKVKFKAWHIKEGIMCDVKVLTDEGAFLVGVKLGEDEYYNGGKTIVEAPKDGRFCDNDEFELMQDTQMVDKHGNDIYSGHICGYYNNFTDKYMLGVVVYNLGCYWFHNNGERRSLPSLFAGVPPIIPLCSPSDFEIKGNIYANPELLGDNN